MSLGVGKQAGEVVAVYHPSLELSTHLLSLRATTAPPSKLRSYTFFRAFSSTYISFRPFSFSLCFSLQPSYFLSSSPSYLCFYLLSTPPAIRQAWNRARIARTATAPFFSSLPPSLRELPVIEFFCIGLTFETSEICFCARVGTQVNSLFRIDG